VTASLALSGAWLGAAVFSPCRKWRYRLARDWGDQSNRVAFIGLNPSTADEMTNDRTIGRCVWFAKAWGFGALDMLNLFAMVSTNPIVLDRVDDPVGFHNDDTIAHVVGSARRVVMAWGSHRRIGALLEPRAARWRTSLLNDPSLLEVGDLGVNADGQPKHPLYLSKDTAFNVRAHWNRP
jgi:hypothetical protein